MQETELRWYHYAACQGIDLNYFFDNYESDPVVAKVVDDSICGSCPVRAWCRQEGEDNKETGVWGGVYLDKGRVDQARNAHKDEETWRIVNEY